MKCACGSSPRRFEMMCMAASFQKTVAGQVGAHHLKVEHQIQFADIAEVPVESLHQTVDELQNRKLVLQTPALPVRILSSSPWQCS